MNKRGRKKIVYDEKILKKVIDEYLEDKGKLVTIKYKEIFQYCKSRFESGQFPYQLSEDFWRKQGKQGRTLIDNHNNLILPTGIKKTPNIVINTANIINSLSKDSQRNKEKMINTLKVNELGYLKLIEKYNKLLERNIKLQNQIDLLSEQKQSLKDYSKVYEEVLFQWADLSSSTDIPLINTITTGKTHTKVVDKLFQEMFSDDPNKSYKDINSTNEEKNNIVKFEKVKNKNTLITDFEL